MRFLPRVLLSLVLLSSEIIGNPLQFPDGTSEGRSLEAVNEDLEPRFHHHKKKKIHKIGCGQGNKRFKREDPEGRFFFPILNYYDTDIIVSNGYTDGSGCDGDHIKPGVGKPPIGGGPVGFGNLGSGLASLGSGIGNFGSELGSSFGSLFPSIGNGIPSLGGSSSNYRPTRPPLTRPPAPVFTRPPLTRPPAPVFTRPPLTRPPTTFVTRPPLIVSPPQTSTDKGDYGDNEDYDYTDFSTTVRSRPLYQEFTGHRPRPVNNPLANNIKPVFERPERYFNRYVVRPINRTLREFYSLF